MKTPRFFYCLSALVPVAIVAATLTGRNNQITSDSSSLSEVQSSRVFLSTSPLTSKENLRKEMLPSKVASSLVFYEDFESVTAEEPYDLPSGWTSIANPGRVDDKWLAGRLFDESGQVMGSSGEKYAFILPDTSNPHDAWMFTPAFTIEDENDYKLSLYTIMLPNRDVMESLEIALCTSASPDAIVSTLLTKKDDCKNWTYIEAYINDQPGGTYYIGFHANAEANSGGLIVDDVMLTNVNAPIFLGAASINFGSKYTENPATETVYEIWNDGYSPLEVSLESVSPEITVTGLPVTIDPSDKVELSVKLDVSTVGDYLGEIVFATNDPTAQTIKVPVRQSVMSIPLGNSKLHTFEDGTPESYKNSNAIVNNLIGKGVDGSRSLFIRKDLTNANIASFYTDFVDLGSKPFFRMDFMLQKEKMMGTVIEAMEADSPKLYIYITDDYGLTWTEVYRMAAGEENEFDGTMDYHHVDINLSEYAGKTCCMRMDWSGNLVSSGMLNKADMGIYMDNMMLGTPYQTDLVLSQLSGPTLAEVGTDNQYSVVVANYGNAEVSGYSVNVTDEAGQTVATFSGVLLEPYEKKTFTFSHVFETSGSHSLTAECLVSGDADESDNTSIPLYVAVPEPDNKTKFFPLDEGAVIQWTEAVPVNFYAFASSNADLYYANEIGINRAVINSLVYDVKGDEYRSDLFRVYLTEADIDEFADDSEWPAYNEMVQVFEGRIHFLPGQSKMIIPFDAPYEYTGKNLIVYTEHFCNEFIYGRRGAVVGSEKKRELSADVDKILTNNSEYPEGKKQAYNRYASVTFNISEPEDGSVSGRVVNLNNEPIGGVTVAIGETSFSTLTDEEGKFSMPRVAVGEYEMVASKDGYYPGSTSFEVTEGENAEIEIRISDVAKQTVSGKVVDLDNNPVAGSVITFDGKIPGQAVTDTQGSFSTELYGESDYDVTVLSDYYTPLRTSISINNEPVTLNCKVDAIKAHPHNPDAILGENANVTVNWEDPLMQMHHDTGNFQFELGYDYGYSEIIFGSAYHEKALVKEVSWYMTDLMAHDDFHVYVFGLTNGQPDPEKILYHAENVHWTDNAWNTHVLETPVEADGFMVAVGCTGFMCIGVTDANDNYPYIPNTEFYAGDSYRFHISEIATSVYKDNHWMLRAGVEKPETEIEVTRPEIQTYTVYRYNNVAQKWEEVGRTDKLTYTDNLLSLPDGYYRWGVEAEYSHGNSSRPTTETITYVTSEVGSILSEDCVVFYNGMIKSLEIRGTEYFSEVRIYDATGAVVGIYEPIEGISLGSLESGAYISVAYLKDGSVIITRFIK